MEITLGRSEINDLTDGNTGSDGTDLDLPVLNAVVVPRLLLPVPLVLVHHRLRRGVGVTVSMIHLGVVDVGFGLRLQQTHDTATSAGEASVSEHKSRSVDGCAATTHSAGGTVPRAAVAQLVVLHDAHGVDVEHMSSSATPDSQRAAYVTIDSGIDYESTVQATHAHGFL